MTTEQPSAAVTVDLDAGHGGTVETNNPAAIDVSELIGIIDRLEELLERSALSELEVEAGGTTVLLRKPLPAAQAVVTPAAPFGRDAGQAESRNQAAATADSVEPASGLHAVVAPLTGVFYLAPSPGAAPYVREGGEVNVGQVIGLVEAMKLFNEIKSDIGGVVRRIAAESGALVKARQTLIEVEPW
jgi:acetyl-CoA carboxylase biotin carboxyl carrier protein